jgi:DNA-binding PadR family transcriptional regulator
MQPTDLIPLNPRDYLVLFSLTEGARHGYGIVKEIERESAGRVRVDPANLYRSLKRMIASGLIIEAPGEEADEPGAERRKYYAITDFGRQVVSLEAARLAELTAVARQRELIPEQEAAG